jgi:hypothetical protein
VLIIWGKNSSLGLNFLFPVQTYQESHTWKESFSFFFVLGALGCGQKCLMLVWRYHQLLPRFLAKGHLPRVSRQSSLSANDGMIPEVVHRSPGICLTAEENSKTFSQDTVWQRPCDQPSPQMGSLPQYKGKKIAQHVRKGEGRKKGRKERALESSS